MQRVRHDVREYQLAVGLVCALASRLASVGDGSADHLIGVCVCVCANGPTSHPSSGGVDADDRIGRRCVRLAAATVNESAGTRVGRRSLRADCDRGWAHVRTRARANKWMAECVRGSAELRRLPGGRSAATAGGGRVCADWRALPLSALLAARSAGRPTRHPPPSLPMHRAPRRNALAERQRRVWVSASRPAANS